MKMKPPKERWDTRRVKILLTAARLFVEQGYDNTGMRQIAEEARVSLSLANYHFGSKRKLGILLIQGHLRALEPYVAEFAGHDPRIITGTWLRLNYVLMNQPHLQKFYVDTLLNDIYLHALAGSNVDQKEQDALTLGDMYWLLGDSYIPVSMERALVMCPFTEKLDLDVPDFIIHYFIHQLPGQGEPPHPPEWYVAACRAAVERILTKYPHLYDIFYEIPEIVAKCI
jgi:AcrR family transcriptional regulator